MRYGLIRRVIVCIGLLKKQGPNREISLLLLFSIVSFSAFIDLDGGEGWSIRILTGG
jgi:hypothetical protein